MIFDNRGNQQESSFPPVTEKSAFQNQFVEADILPTDKNVYILNTQKRIGCDAALLLDVEQNGTVHSVVTHFDPEHVSDHLKVVQTKAQQHPKGKRYAVLVTRGEEGEPWRQKLESALTNYAGTEVETVELSQLGVEHLPEIANPETRLN